MSKPLVSVITTVYNCEEFIEESLESIFSQTFKDFEFIVFNDASTDNTWEIIERCFRNYDGDYVIIDSDKDTNLGCPRGRQVAMSRAKGKYYAIHDGDDNSYSNRLEREVEFLEDNPEIFCVGSWADSINGDGSHREVMNFPPDNHNSFIDSLFQGNNTFLDPTAMMRADIFHKLGGYDNKWNLIPDMHLWTKAVFEHCYITSLQESLVAHRKHSGSVMMSSLREVIMQHRFMHKLLLEGVKKEGFYRY